MHPHGARAAHRSIAAGLSSLAAAALLFGVARPAAAQVAGTPPAAAMEEEAELPHAFFTHMGLPEGVGVFNLRTLGLATRADAETKADFAFHLETGGEGLSGPGAEGDHHERQSSIVALSLRVHRLWRTGTRDQRR